MKLFVWDFHGVLEKGNDEAVVEITNRVLYSFGHSRRMTTQEGEFLSGKRWYEYFAFLLPHLNHQEHLALQAACIDTQMKEPEIIAKHIQLNDHAHFVLQSIADCQLTQILISNTQPKALDLFVKIVGIEKYFPSSHRFGVDSHSQRQITKLDCLRAFLEDKKFPEGIISIGDSPGDMALIHQYPNAIGYLYTHPGRVHREANCHYKIQDLREVLREITEMSVK
jgi:hypothetical protein